MTKPILIVGAGPTGLVLALWLARAGVPFRIVDKASGPGQASRAMVVQARTLEFYDQLGIADAVVAQGIRMTVLHLRRGNREVARMPLGEMGLDVSPAPYTLTYPQDDHERLLVAELAAVGVAIEWDTELTAFEEHADGVRATLVRDGGREVCEANYLCGCDGGHSRVRQGLGIEFGGGTYAQLFYVVDAKVAISPTSDGFMNLGAKAFALMLPVRSSGMHRLIGLVPEALSGRKDIGFEDLRATIEPLIGTTVQSINWFSTYHSDHRIASQFRRGRCFLAGDAGHVHSPAGGQGMNTGIGDAVNLAWKLADVVRGRASPGLLDTYEPERIAFARKLVATTDRAFRGAIQGGRAGEILRTWLLPSIVPRLFDFAATRRLLFATISQTRISYRGVAPWAGTAGSVQGGDRLPWVEAAGNFASLRSRDWQMHVYGTPKPALADAAAKLGLPLHAFAWSERAARIGLGRDAAYLLRPDGHVALALPDQSAGNLRDVAARLGLALGG